ncbi:hypothetical protein EV421DRAFT_1896508 [Armillaria borealis]|uniref:Uncharacterized protein n=1 Tax=Armillaria borealis TaxID=47425 RepID=A0AA39K4U1_9AGAR|nr:hypothetical protein EV421DRAFT_1896508 [Armillaria borealis]
MPYELPDPRNTTSLPTADEAYPYNKFAGTGETPSILPAGSATPFTNAAYPRLYVPWNHLTAGFPKDLRNDIAASPDKFLAGLPYGAGPKWYAESPRADLLLKEFLDGFDFPDKGTISLLPSRGKGREEGEKGRSQQEERLRQAMAALSSRVVWNFVPFNPKALAWVISAYQGNVVRNDQSLIAEALACLKVAVWRDIPLQILVKSITRARGKSGNPVELTVKMTQSWRLVYTETKNLDNDKGEVLLLIGEPITEDLDLHRALAAHIRRLRVRVNYQRLLNVDKIIGCDWCKNQDHPSHACPFPGIYSAARMVWPNDRRT